MKKLFLGLAAILSLLCCNKEIESISVVSVSIDNKAVEMMEDEVIVLTATCTITVTKPSHGVDIGDWEGDGSDDGGIAS